MHGKGDDQQNHWEEVSDGPLVVQAVYFGMAKH